MDKMNGLLSAYAIYYVALVFCMPDLIVSFNAPKSKYQLGQSETQQQVFCKMIDRPWNF